MALQADGRGQTYDLIGSVFGIETPDCGHESFGDHITEIYDESLGAHVFAFHLHVDEDDDRCQKQDRQRNEIKGHPGSPDNLKGAEGEQVLYKHKMKLDSGFQASRNFSHLFQLKPVGDDGPGAGGPLLTLTARHGDPTQLQILHGPDDSTDRLIEADVSPFLGTWVEITQTVSYGPNGSYKIAITAVDTDETLLSYSNDSLPMWKSNADYVRPKWGLYRSLNSKELLRDETVYFTDFLVAEL